MISKSSTFELDLDRLHRVWEMGDSAPRGSGVTTLKLIEALNACCFEPSPWKCVVYSTKSGRTDVAREYFYRLMFLLEEMNLSEYTYAPGRNEIGEGRVTFKGIPIYFVSDLRRLRETGRYYLIEDY